MLKKADLHIHTQFSDGTFSPQEVIQYASKIGLACIAICDHDVIDGLETAMQLGEQCGIEVIPGVELTAEKQGAEIHILGYYIDWRNQKFVGQLAQLCKQREKRIYDMVEKLKAHGVKLDVEEVFKLGGKGSIGRLHLARALSKKGFIAGVDEAFKKYIGNGKPCYVGKINLTPEEAIGRIISAGGIPVLAHPGVMGKDEFLPSYIKHGLMGLEVYHTDHPPALVRHYEALAGENGLLVTGGSDCHGLGKGRVLMGCVTVPYELVEKLKNARR
ncbi:MAG: PHP domain-containing protein [Candidatus Omnitrophica bacterium]|nr:PHP domain-containing protein [Candidatus Omnitrophota bacterium]